MTNGQLTVREIRGPYMQLLTNLQGENGREWLEALKMFNSRKNPWIDSPDRIECLSKVEAILDEMKAAGKTREGMHALARVLQSSLSCKEGKIQNSTFLDYIMRAVSVAIEDSDKPDMRRDYILNNLRQGTEALEKWIPTQTPQ